MIAITRKRNAWGWDATDLACSCLTCNRCLRHRPAQNPTLFTQPFRITRMTQRFLPLLFPAVDQPISRVSSHMLFDCPRLERARPLSRVGNAHLPPPLNQPAQPSQRSV